MMPSDRLTALANAEINRHHDRAAMADELRDLAHTVKHQEMRVERMAEREREHPCRCAPHEITHGDEIPQ